MELTCSTREFFNLGLVSSFSWKPRVLKRKEKEKVFFQLLVWTDCLFFWSWFWCKFEAAFALFFSWSLSQFGLFISAIWYFKLGEVFPLFVLFLLEFTLGCLGDLLCFFVNPFVKHFGDSGIGLQSRGRTQFGEPRKIVCSLWLCFAFPVYCILFLWIYI